MAVEDTQNIWEILAIEQTTDEREIKRAYAKQLKLTPPNEDPIAFQKLREARDEAMWLAKFDFDEEDDDHEYEDDEAHDKETPAPIAPHSDASRTQTPRNELDEPPIEPTSPEQIANSRDENERNLQPPHITPDIEQSEGEEQHREQKTSTATGKEPHQISADEFTEKDIEHELERLTGPWSNWDKTHWRAFINELRESPFETTEYAEYEILQTITESLAQNATKSKVQRAAQQQVMIYLDQEFGWTQNDRRVYSILGDHDAEALLRIMRNQSSDDDLSGERLYYDVSGFPYLTAEDFHLYLGKKDTIYEQYYQQCQTEGRKFKRAWSWPGFLASPLWLVHRCNDGMESLVGIIYVVALFFIGYGYVEGKLIQLSIGIAMIISMHILTGLYGKRLLINTMASVFTEVEEDEKLTKKQKRKKIKQTGQGGMKAVLDFSWGMLGIAVIGGVILAILLQ